jgi:hypothetical protein
MAGTKRITHASQSTEEKTGQLELWTLLADTRVVTDAAGTALVPWQAEDRSAEAPGRAPARKKRRCGSIPQDVSRSRMVLAPAKFGNRTILRRRD